MCGICGELRFDGVEVVAPTISRMMTKLEKRGPDSFGLTCENNIGFGHRRLAVIDLSEKSNQPMLDAALGLRIVFNGSIYNYKQIRTTLRGKGYTFFSEGDTEVILKAYHYWKEDCVTHLHGMFAFAIWDEQKRELFVGRDRLGIKPLYFSQTDKFFRFASNVQALLAGGDVDTAIDTSALHHLFTLHAVVPAPRTIFRGVRKVPPAHTLTIKENGKTIQHCYWELNAQRPSEKLSEDEWIQATHEALRQAVKVRKEIADVPVGVLLSGGLDSSLLVALLAEAGVKDILTFSIGFDDIGDEQGSEFEFSDAVVERYATQHQKMHVDNTEVLKRLPEAVAAMSEPMFAQDAVAFYLLSEQVSKHVKVVQSGQGADEVFGGYFWYPQMNEARGDDLTRFRQHYFDRDHDEYLQMISSKYASDDVTSAQIQHLLNQAGADEFMDKVLRMDVTTLIVDDPVKRVDNMTMAWGLEARVPFLDHKVVELVAKMPVALKLKSGGKHPLKVISRGLLPDKVIDRPKGYFPMPALKYVRGEFHDFMGDILNSQACLARGLYQRRYVDKLLREPESHHTRLNGSKLWHLALLEYWLQKTLAA
ncbi:MAG TPA: N-acetylglutaminylglutamine amidotransferase [Gammaproteobacteria bacterium]|nr:N-acetylglutaminylglutamine amidotransferase [Gammaproteobacteria bacterium]